MSEFIHLHNHSHYSILDGITKIKDLALKAAEFGQSAVALTDHGNMFGKWNSTRNAKPRESSPFMEPSFT